MLRVSVGTVAVVLLCVVFFANNASAEKPALIFWHGYGMSFRDLSKAVQPNPFVKVMNDIAVPFYGQDLTSDPPVFSMSWHTGFPMPVKYTAFKDVKEDDKRTSFAMDLKDQVALSVAQLVTLVQNDAYVRQHGMVFLAFSQGGVVARAVIQCLKPTANADHRLLLSLIHLLATFGSPHEGIGNPPKHFYPKDLQAEGVTKAMIETFLEQTSPFKHLTRTRTTITPHGEVRNLLAEINNEDNAINLSKLKAFIMIQFTSDEVANPISTQCMVFRRLALNTVCHPFDGGHLNFEKAPPGWEGFIAKEIRCFLYSRPEQYGRCVIMQQDERRSTVQQALQANL